MTVCSGIGAPEVSAPWIDWRYQSEIEPFPCAVLRERFPHAENLGDMTKFKEWPNANVDVLVGGTPCQSFSLAGLRKGLNDPRGNLMLTFLAIAERYAPRWIVWENVPGVLSSNGGRDFGSFLGGLGQLGYGWAYRVVDAQYVRTPRFPHAVPQRRRRVFVVGCFGDWTRAAAVLFEPEGMRGNPPPRREAGKVATTIPARSTGGGGLGADFDCDGGLIAEPVAASLRCRRPAEQGQASDFSHVVVNGGRAMATLDAMMDKKFGSNQWVDSEQFVICASDGQANAGFGENVGTTLTSTVEQPYVLHANAGALPVVAFDPNQITSKANRSQPDPAVHHTLPAASTPPHLAAPHAVRRLTPRECERLQGFPDEWTQIPYRNKPADACPDGPRYKALGNSWAVNCGEFIFDRIRAVEEMFPAHEAEAHR